MFTPAAVAAGAGAVFGFPLQVGTTTLGALNLYRRQPGSLTEHQYADALIASDLVARALLAMPVDLSATGTSDDANGAGLHLVVHQATGMVAAQLDAGVTDALSRLRAHAFATDRPLRDIARDVVSRQLRFDADGDAKDLSR